MGKRLKQSVKSCRLINNLYLKLYTVMKPLFCPNVINNMISPKKKKMCLMSYWQEAAASYHCVQKTKLNKLHTERMKCSLKTILSNINFTPIWAVYSPAQSHVKVSLYLSRKLNILASRIVTLHPNEENTPLLSIEFKWISST